MIKFNKATKYITLLIPSSIHPRAAVELFRMNGFACSIVDVPPAEPGAPPVSAVNGPLPMIAVDIPDEELTEWATQAPIVLDQTRNN